MIIEQDKPDFKPIVITLQDAAEAEAFWIMLHEAENRIFGGSQPLMAVNLLKWFRGNYDSNGGSK
jgi:hypothetical protein